MNQKSLRRSIVALLALLAMVLTPATASAQEELPSTDTLAVRVSTLSYLNEVKYTPGARTLNLVYTDSLIEGRWWFLRTTADGRFEQTVKVKVPAWNYNEVALPLIDQMPCGEVWPVVVEAQAATGDVEEVSPDPNGVWQTVLDDVVDPIEPECIDDPPTTEDITVVADIGRTVEFEVPTYQRGSMWAFLFDKPAPTNGVVEQIDGGRFSYTPSARGSEMVETKITICLNSVDYCPVEISPGGDVPPQDGLFSRITFEAWESLEAPSPSFDPDTGLLTVPSRDGVVYHVNGNPYPGGEPAYQVCGTATVDAHAETIRYFRLTGTTSWTYEYDCDADQTETVVERVAGSDRYATAAAVAMKFGTADRVFIASGQAHADAMVSSAAAEPVLLTRSDSLPAVSRAALASLKPKQIVIVGGESRVSAKVEADLRQYGQVIRVAGSDRYATAAKFLQERGQVDVVYLANGLDGHFPDALSAGARSGSQGAAVLLTRQNALPGATVAALRDAQPGRVVLVGGEDVVSRQVAKQLEGMGFSPERLSGPDRYQTALAVSRTFDSANIVFVASGAEFPDALSGGALAGYRGGPMLLTRPDRLPNGVIDEIRRLGAKEVYLLGGTGAVSESVERQLRDLLND